MHRFEDGLREMVPVVSRQQGMGGERPEGGVPQLNQDKLCTEAEVAEKGSRVHAVP